MLKKSTLNDILEKQENSKYRLTLFTLHLLGMMSSGDDRELVYKSLDLKNAMFNILPTYGCNFSCEHCYEYSIMDNKTMSKEVEIATAEFIKRTIKEKAYDRVILQWHGGEPLLCLDVILRIGSEVKNYCEKNNVAYRSILTTNGSLATPDVVWQLIKTTSLDHVQFTFSGPKEMHDHERHFANGNGSFDLLIENMLSILEKCPVSFEIGFMGDAPDWEKRFEFIEYLGELKSREKVFADAIRSGRVSLRLATIFPPLNISDIVTSKFNPYFDFNKNRGLEAGRILIRGVQIAKSIGFDVSGSIFITGLCAIYNKHDYKIDPYGNLFCCHFLIDEEINIIGNVYSGVDEERREIQYGKALNYLDREPCMRCRYARVCHNSCRALVYAHTGKIDGLHCDKEVYDELLVDSIKMELGLDKEYYLVRNP